MQKNLAVAREGDGNVKISSTMKSAWLTWIAKHHWNPKARRDAIENPLMPVKVIKWVMYHDRNVMVSAVASELLSLQ